MGYHLALWAEQQTRISPRAFRVLNRMAWHARDTAKDNVPARLYFGGWQPLYLLFPDLEERAAHMAVARAIKELKDAGLIKSLGVTPTHRQTARYEILM